MMQPRLSIQFKDNLYTVEGQAAYTFEKMLVDAGFIWDPQHTRFVTTHWQTAMQFEGNMDDSCYQSYLMHKQKASILLQLSMSDSLIDPNIPRPKNEDYDPYQQAAIRFGSIVNNVLLADECGLGKTMEAIGIINMMQKDGRRLRVLVICKAAARINWKRELDKWLVHNFGTHVCSMYEGLNEDAVQILNYEILFQHNDAIHAQEWDVFILDEAHRVKNTHSERGALVLGWKNEAGEWQYPPIKAKKNIYITATPQPNGRPKEIWPLIHSLDPVTWPSWKAFALEHCGAYYKKSKRKGVPPRLIIPPDGASNLPELQLKLRSTIMVRREKDAVLKQLPPKRRQVVELPTDGCEKVIQSELRAWSTYAVQLDKLKAAVKKAEKNKGTPEYLKAVAALKDGLSYSFRQMSKMRLKTALAKLPMVLAHIDEMVNDGQKFIIFGWHTDVLNAIKAHLGDKVVGGPGSVKQADIDRFQTDPTCLGFIGNIIAAGESITLTAAERVLFVELSWVPGDLTQAEDRAHRRGLLHSVLVQHLVLEGSLDATMAKKLIRKQKRNDQTFDKDKMDADAVAAIIDDVDGESEVIEMEMQRS